VITAILHALLAIPKLADFLRWFAGEVREIDRKRNEAEAAQRLADKDARVDAAINDWLQSSHQKQPERPADRTPGFQSAMRDLPRVETRRPQDH
jgi:hypothetical protein